MKADPEVAISSGSLWKSIWRLSWPLLIIMVLNFIVGVTDIYVAGLIGPRIQAAVGFVSQFYFLVVVVASAVSIGTMAMVSRAVGAGDFRLALHISRQSLIFGLGAGVLISTGGFVFHEEIIALAGVPHEIREVTGNFLRIFVLALGPNYALIISNSVFNASGEVKKPLLTMSVVTVFNVAAVFAFVYGLPFIPAMGYRGIAFATAASLFIGMFVNLIFFSRGRWMELFRDSWRPSGETIKKLIRIGLPAAMIQITWNASGIIIYNILGRLGDASVTALAAISNGLRIEAIIYMPAIALHVAASVLTGQNLGAGVPERAEQAGWRIASAGIMFVTVIAVIFYIKAEYLASLLTSDPDVLVETARYLRYNMFSEPFMAMGTIFGGALQGSGDTRGTLKVVATGMWLVRIPLAWVLALVLNFGAAGVWSAMLISHAVQGILMTVRFRKGGWKHLKVL